MTDTSDIRQDMAATRERMARDVDELKDHVTAPLRSVKHQLNVTRIVREHPWPALGAAVVLGAVIGGSGADQKAASATADGAKRAARASKEAAASAIQRFHSDASDEDAVVDEPEKPGISSRLAATLGVVFARGLDRLLDEMRTASVNWGQRVASPDNQGRRSNVAAPVAAVTVAVVRDEARTASPADQVPVPNEMLPTELGARADAVEALGGGTNEPPLAPGAGELGARWA
jgi:hypothetical protein